LYARKNKGDFFLRIEDTDQKRIVPDAIQKLIESLFWAGISYDEGIFIDPEGEVFEKGEYGPYVQSKRLEIYKKYAHELVEKGKAYYCFCTPQRLDSLRSIQEKAKLAPAYDKLCLKEVTPEEAKRRVASGEKYVIRFDVPEAGETEFEDVVRGKIKFSNINLDDFVILKSDGFPTYHLAHVVDDHLMETTTVFRSEEWLPSAPKHILMFEAFGWEPPQYGHLCTILNKETKKKLSKRDGDVSVDDFRKKGYLPEAIVNFIALLGWNPKTEQELFSLDELIENFDEKKLNKAGAVFDIEKLDWMNGIYIRKKDVRELSELCRPYFENFGEKIPEHFLEKIVTVERERIKNISEIVENTHFYFSAPKYEKKLLAWKDMGAEKVIRSLEKSLGVLENINDSNWSMEKLKEELLDAADPKNRGELLWPLRAALSGKEKSSSPFEIAWVLGKKKSIERINMAIKITKK